MAKWHNGPKGPGVCKATKGNCPFGGSEDHYASKEEAMEIYNKKNEEEFGLIPKTSKGPWAPNTNPWTGSKAFSATGIKDEEIFVREAEEESNKIEFFSRVVSNDGIYHIISKGTIDLKDKKVSKRAVENEYGVKQKDDPVQFMKNVVSYYGGDSFDNDPVYLNARQSKDIVADVEQVYREHGIPLDKDEQFVKASNDSESSANVIFPSEDEGPKKRKNGYSDEDYMDI